MENSPEERGLTASHPGYGHEESTSPLVLPGLSDGHDRTFFFADDAGLKENVGVGHQEGRREVPVSSVWYGSDVPLFTSRIVTVAPGTTPPDR